VYLGMLSHPHLVKLVGFCNQDDHRMLVYEYMPRQSLENHLFKSKHCTDATNNTPLLICWVSPID